MIFAFDGFELNAERFELRRNGRVLKLDSPVLRLLVALVRRADQLVLKDELVEEVWEGRAVADNVITVAMARLRKILRAADPQAQFITTAYGRGYRFVRPVTILEEPSMVSSNRPTRMGEPPLVGRGQPLARLQSAVLDARAGNGRFFALMGEAGIGKSHLVEHLDHTLSEREVRVAWGYCRELGQSPPLWPFQQILDDLEGSDPHAARSPDSDTSAEELRTGPAAAPERDAATLGTDTSTRHRTLQRMLQAFIRASERTPLVLVLDDLDRADLASLELLSLLVDRVGRSRMLIVATLRTDAVGRLPQKERGLSEVLGHRNCERILLARLAREDVAHYVSSVLRDPDGQLTEAVFQKSEGNPFFMAELSRKLMETHPPRPEALAVPDAALELVRQRVAKLDDGARGLLTTCAVIGRSFELRLLAEITERPAAQLMLELDSALSAGVLTLAESGKTRFVFSHELLRSVLYDALPAPQRRAQHLRTAEALERRRTASDPIADSELAYHFHAALPTGDLRKTVQYCRAAANAAVSVLAYADASRHTRSALEALSLMDRPSVRLRMSLLYMTAIYSRPQDPASYLSCTEELIRLGREHQDGEMLVRAGALLHAHPLLRPLPAAASVLQQGLELLPSANQAVRAVGLACLAGTQPASFDATHCEALAEQAVALAEQTGSRGACYMALSTQLYVFGGPAHPDTSSEVQLRLEALAQQNPVELAALPVDLGLLAAGRALSRGDLPRASATLERAVVRAREIQHEELTWHAERALCLVNWARGQTGAAHEALRRAHERARRLGLFGVELYATCDRILVLREHASALDDEPGLARSLRYDPEDPPAAWAVKAHCLGELGWVDEARSALRAVAPEGLQRLPCDAHYLSTLAHLTHAALLVDESAYYAPLQRLLSRYRSFMAAGLFAGPQGVVSRFTALLGAALGASPASVCAELAQAAECEARWGANTCALETQRTLERLQIGGSSSGRGRRAASQRPNVDH